MVRESITGKKNPNYRGGKFKTCVICQTEFWVKPSALEKRKCCSRLCKDKLHSKHMTGEGNSRYGEGKVGICLTCKKEFRYSKSQNKKHCSMQCYKKYGEKNPNWNGGISQTYAFTLIEKDKCWECGTKKDLCLHHKDHNRQNNVKDNFEILCKRCHSSYHIRKRNKECGGNIRWQKR